MINTEIQEWPKNGVSGARASPVAKPDVYTCPHRCRLPRTCTCELPRAHCARRWSAGTARFDGFLQRLNPLPVQSVAHGVEWWTRGGLERMGSARIGLHVRSGSHARALDEPSPARGSCTKEGAAAFANSEKAMWPVAEVSCSRVLACGEGSFAKDVLHFTAVQVPTFTSDA